VGRVRPHAIAIGAAQRVWESHRLFLKSPRVTVHVKSGATWGYVAPQLFMSTISGGPIS
jgi:hypothetical protein